MARNASKGAAKHDYSHRVAEVKKHLVLFAMRILSRMRFETKGVFRILISNLWECLWKS